MCKNISIPICIWFLLFFQVEIEAQCDCSHDETEKQHEVKQNRRVGSSKHPLLWQTAPHHCELKRDGGRESMKVYQHIHLDDNWLCLCLTVRASPNINVDLRNIIILFMI